MGTLTLAEQLRSKIVAYEEAEKQRLLAKKSAEVERIKASVVKYVVEHTGNQRNLYVHAEYKEATPEIVRWAQEQGFSIELASHVGGGGKHFVLEDDGRDLDFTQWFVYRLFV